MFKEIYNKIFKTNGTEYDPNQKTGDKGSDGSQMPDQPTPESGNGYQANANTAGKVNVDGGQNTDLNARTTMKDVQDWHTNATQEMLGNPQVARPMKNDHRNVDAQLESQYFGDMRKY
ncbi:Uncharacterised protein [uncultured archaeon]|nr:Uncharacterised protein [uncultured archaeon]